MKNGIKSLAVWLIFLIIFIVLISSIMDNSSNKLAYSELLADMEKGTVKSIEIQAGGEKALVEVEGESLPKEVNIPDINSFMTYAQEILKPESVFMKGLYLLIPFGIIVIVLLFGLLLINPGNQGGNKTMSFGKSKARVTNGAEKTKVTFNDVAGVDEEKEELTELVDFLKKEVKLSVVPGGHNYFGDQSEGHVRICIATSKGILHEGLNRLKLGVEKFVSQKG